MAENGREVLYFNMYVVLFVLVFTRNSVEIDSVATSNKYPNIVLITANQFGLEDIRYYEEHIQHITKLAQDGITFSHAYSNLYPTSSRAALLTGRLPVKSGMLKGRFLPFTSLPSVACSGGMPLNEETIAEVLERRDYTNKFIGLWDLGLGKDGKFLPLNQGFQSWFGTLTRHTEGCSTLPRGSVKHVFDEVMLFLCLFFTFIFGAASLWYFRYLKPRFLLYCFALGGILYATNQSFRGITFINVRSCVLYRDHSILAQPYDVENLTLRFTEEAMYFIKQAVSDQHPFFLTVNHIVFSKPLFSSRISRNISGKSDRFLDSLMDLDWSVGSILGTIAKVNLTDDTIVIFTALSGLNHVNVTLAGSSQMPENEEPAHSKGKNEPDNWESHIKVPLYIKWTNKWKGGWTINETVTLMDVMPTVLELTNQSYSNETIDGKSLLPLITSNFNSSDSLHKFVFHYLDVTQPSAVTYGKYKAFYRTKTGDGSNANYDPPLLYNIREDPLETSALPVDEYPEVISNISEAIEKHLENRSRKWISQFEHPIFPWLFPCANFPYCYRTDIHKTNRIFDTTVSV